MTKQDMPVITVIVPVYQHWELAFKLISALENQTLQKELWHVYLVDNGSDSIPESHELPNYVTLLKCPQPGSYAARNMALQHVKNELVVFTDADCRPAPEWLEQIWSTYKQSTEAVLVAGGVQVVKFGNEIPNQVETYDIALGLPQARYVKNGYAVTANLAVPLTIFKDVGFFDSSRFSGGDAEFCRRAVAKGYKLLYNDKAYVCHPARASWAELATKVRRVKGGQIRSGSSFRRVQYFIRAFLPPMRAYIRILRDKSLNFKQKVIVTKVQSKLWLVEIIEVSKLLFGKQPERR